MSIHIQENISLAPLTTFKIGGAAKYFTEVSTEGEMREALDWATAHSEKVILLAGGSNVLIPDQGLSALVLRVIGNTYDFQHNELRAQSGCGLLDLIHAGGKRGLGGWEKLAGIPGTIGGAARGNAGAFGSEIKDFVGRVVALNIETKKTREFTKAECTFAYRESFFKAHPEWVIMHVVIGLQNIDPAESEKIAAETIREREKRHIQNVCAAGSYFKNPVAPKEVIAMFESEKGLTSRGGRVPAGWLIEKAGMKGASIGKAQASMQHPNYIVNTGGATSKDVRALAEEIKLQVEKKFGIELKEEAVII